MPRRQSNSHDDLPAVKSISRAVNIINCLSDGVNTLTDIAAICGLSKSTVHRLLRALESTELVIQDNQNHKYYLGPLIVSLVASPETMHSTLITCAQGDLVKLSELMEETVNLCVMPAIQNLVIYEVISVHDLRVTEGSRKVGQRFAGAPIKVQLAQLADDQIRTVMKHVTLERYTPYSITGKEKFIRLVKETREAGYSVSIGEAISGVVAVAAPIPGYTYPAAVSLVGPESRMKPRIDTIIKEVCRTAKNITEKVRDANDSKAR